MAAYNGHESWNAWNVALWINTDEKLYRMAVDLLDRHNGDYKLVARLLRSNISGATTPDGARYTRRSIYLALHNLAVERRIHTVVD